MNIEQSKQITSGAQPNAVLQGDCVAVMRQFRGCSVDFVLTDPPYLAHYRSRDGRTVANDSDGAWLRPAFAEIFRVLRRDSFCVSFYGWVRPESRSDDCLTERRHNTIRPVIPFTVL
jgi:DNA modification methylase